MRNSELIAKLSEYPDYWEVQAGGVFVTDVHDETQIKTVPRPGGGGQRVASVVVVIA